MAKREPLHDRFKRLIAGQGLPELELATGLSRDQIRRLSSGNTKTLDMAAGIRLADYLGKSHYEVAGVPEPAKPASTFSFRAIERRPVGSDAERALQRLAKPPTPKALPSAQPSPDDAAAQGAAADYWAKRLSGQDLPEGEHEPVLNGEVPQAPPQPSAPLQEPPTAEALVRLTVQAVRGSRAAVAALLEPGVLPPREAERLRQEIERGRTDAEGRE